MNNIVDFISQPWEWYVSGPLISLVMLALILFGKRFGLSSNFKTMCTIAGAGKHASFFQFDWKKDIWNLVFVLGAVIGGALSFQYLGADQSVGISNQTITELQEFGVSDAGDALIPTSIFNWNQLSSIKGIIMMFVGGFLVGFGTRYADGCTSGHAISGLSNFQISSLTAVIGFFIGGLLVTYLVLPYLLRL